MSKAAKTAETIEFPTFDASKATDQFRSFAEKGVEQSKEAYAKFKAGAEEAQKTLESTFETMKKASSEVQLKTVAAIRTAAETDFAHVESMIGAKSLSELFELQTSYLRKRVELAVDQAKEIQAASSKAMEDAARPIKGAFDKALKELKVA